MRTIRDGSKHQLAKRNLVLEYPWGLPQRRILINVYDENLHEFGEIGTMTKGPSNPSQILRSLDPHKPVDLCDVELIPLLAYPDDGGKAGLCYPFREVFKDHMPEFWRKLWAARMR